MIFPFISGLCQVFGSPSSPALSGWQIRVLPWYVRLGNCLADLHRRYEVSQLRWRRTDRYRFDRDSADQYRLKKDTYFLETEDWDYKSYSRKNKGNKSLTDDCAQRLMPMVLSQSGKLYHQSQTIRRKEEQ